MEITVVHGNARVPVTVLHVAGRIDSPSAVILEQKAIELIDGGTRYSFLTWGKSLHGQRGSACVAVNIRKIALIIPRGINKETYRRITDGAYQFPYLKIVNPNSEIMEVLKMSGLDVLVSIEKDLQKALAAV